MAAIRLTATQTQRKNLIKLVQYLKHILTTPDGDRYDQGDSDWCSMGYAIRSRLFDDLNTTHSGMRCVSSCTQQSIVTGVFGADFYAKIVYGDASDGFMAYDFPEGKQQLECVINHIIKAYRFSEEQIGSTLTLTTEVDTTKNKIQERINFLTEFLVTAQKYSLDRTIKLADTVDAVNDEIAALKLALSI